MLPFLGQGACAALEDAVALGLRVEEAGDLGAALAAYEGDRFERTSDLVKGSRRAARIAIVGSALGTRLRKSCSRGAGIGPPAPARQGGQALSEGPEQPRGRRFVEAARRLNRQARLVDAVRRSRERAMGDDEFVGRVSTSRGRPADLAAQHLVELRGERRERSVRSASPRCRPGSGWPSAGPRPRQGRVAVMFTDLVGFSSWALEAGDRAAIRLLREVSEAIEPPIAEHRGEVVKRLGDGLMAAFWDAPSAAEAAFAARERAASIEVEGYRAQLRTGIHLGRPRRIGGDYFGVDVNIAARLADAAKPGEILVSDSALEALEPGAVTATKRRFRAKGRRGTSAPMWSSHRPDRSGPRSPAIGSNEWRKETR